MNTIYIQPPLSLSLDINLKLHFLSKNDSIPKFYKNLFNEIIAQASPHPQIHTDTYQ